MGTTIEVLSRQKLTSHKQGIFAFSDAMPKIAARAGTDKENKIVYTSYFSISKYADFLVNLKASSNSIFSASDFLDVQPI